MSFKSINLSIIGAALAAVSSAAQPEWAQCGGQGYTGGTTCASGLSCVVQNPYYSQCLASAGSVALAVVSSAAQPEWAQCGGQGYTGGTTCASGLSCVVQNPYYSQCLTSAGNANTKPATTVVQTTTARTTTATAVKTPLASNNPSSGSTSGTGATYKASFTHYGAGDTFGSPNCNTNTAACGFYTYPGFSAAASQNLFGVGPGAGAGPACGTCWKLTGQTDSSGNKLSNAGVSIVVMVNNLCPAQGNPLCSQSSLQDTNQYGANVNFDLCSDSGAQAAFFGDDGVGLAIGTAQQVDCSQWSGTVVH